MADTERLQSIPSRKTCAQQGVAIVSVDADGLAARRGVRVGDRLIAIDGQPARDAIDLRFLGAGERVRLEIERDGQRRTIQLRKRYDQALGIEIDPFKIRPCLNNCSFCFCRQQPRGLRASLRFRDDDYRTSFLHGAYITGTNLTPDDLARIASQRLSPLYLSIHATDPAIRGRMLGRPSPAPIAPLMDFLAEKRLVFHAQIVLCPGLNDGACLDRSLADLCAYHPSCRSIAIVPVGLTDHRHGLPPLRSATPRYARSVIDSTASLRRGLSRRTGGDIIYFSDEFHLIAHGRAPLYRGREYWHQLENGVGMIHEFYHGFQPSRLPRRARSPRRIGLVTGNLGGIALRPLVDALNRVDGLDVGLLVARNTLFGERVTVSGLLGSEDIARAIERRRSRYDAFVLPPDCLEPESLRFLDDVTLEALEARLGVPLPTGLRNARDIANFAGGQ